MGKNITIDNPDNVQITIREPKKAPLMFNLNIDRKDMKHLKKVFTRFGKRNVNNIRRLS